MEEMVMDTNATIKVGSYAFGSALFTGIHCAPTFMAENDHNAPPSSSTSNKQAQ
jgi:hypothetical protein